MGGQRSGDRDPLRLPTGQLGGHPSGQLASADFVQPVSGARGRGTLADAVRARPEGHVVEHAQVGEKQWVLGEQGHPAGVGEQPASAAGPQFEQQLVVQDRPARVRPHCAGQDAEQGRLTRAIGPKNGDPFASTDFEVDVESAVGQGRLQADAHRGCASARRAVSAVTKIATATSTNESAVAASGSVADCR